MCAFFVAHYLLSAHCFRTSAERLARGRTLRSRGRGRCCSNTWPAGAGTVRASSTRSKALARLGQVHAFGLDRRHGETVDTLPAPLLEHLAGRRRDGAGQLHQVEGTGQAGAGARLRPGSSPRRDGGHPARGAARTPGRSAPGRCGPAPPGRRHWPGWGRCTPSAWIVATARRWTPCPRRCSNTWPVGAGTSTSSTRSKGLAQLGQVLDLHHGGTVGTLPAAPLLEHLAGRRRDGAGQLHQVEGTGQAGAGARLRPGSSPRRDGGHPARGAARTPGRSAPGRRPAPPGRRGWPNWDRCWISTTAGRWAPCPRRRCSNTWPVGAGTSTSSTRSKGLVRPGRCWPA